MNQPLHASPAANNAIQKFATIRLHPLAILFECGQRVTLHGTESATAVVRHTIREFLHLCHNALQGSGSSATRLSSSSFAFESWSRASLSSSSPRLPNR